MGRLATGVPPEPVSRTGPRQMFWPPDTSIRVPFAQAPDVYALLDERPADALQVVLTYE